jgi:alpha-ketoglutarate-dependent 2,4-dichlorophenoxyacetate dioxygenase
METLVNMTIAPRVPGFVAEIRGIDLREPLAPGQVARIISAADTFPVLVFPDQRIDDAQQLAFSAHFGPLEKSVTGALPGYATNRVDPRVSDVSNVRADNQLFAADDRRRMNFLANQLWHTDSSFKEIPARYSLLSARVIPGAGGETEFADMRAAYDALPSDVQHRIESLVAEHSLFYSRAVIGFTDFTEEERAIAPPMPQVLVRTLSGSHRKSLYLASHASHVIGMPIAEGRLLLRDLMDHATRREFVYQHRWKVGDLVLWDNRCTMHRGRPYDDLGERREMRRTTIQDVASTLRQ